MIKGEWQFIKAACPQIHANEKIKILCIKLRKG
jgi:hypothetical protein